MIDRDVLMRVVEPLFTEKACVTREDILGRIDASPEIAEDDKRILGSLWEDGCYSRDDFHDALQAYGFTSPIGYGSNMGGF